MEPYEIDFTLKAAKQFYGLSLTDQRRLEPKINALVEDARPPGCEKLETKNAYRIRVGDYRVVYLVDDGTRFVQVIKVAHRREVYRDL